MAGIIFDQAGNVGAAIFIAAWNLISVIAEYLLLRLIYKRFPTLANKIRKESIVETEEKSNTGFSVLDLVRSSWSGIIITLKSWQSYMYHPVRNAGLGFAFLYMTVLGFDNITYGFCMRQCVTESVLGALVGISAVFGVLGSLVYPSMRKKIGLIQTGSFGFGCLVATLILSVASIWLDGSPFRADYFINNNKNDTINDDEISDQISNTAQYNASDISLTRECKTSSFISVSVFLAGVISARFGLWIADLSVNQILQEEVKGEERGQINGVQVKKSTIFQPLRVIIERKAIERNIFYV